MTNVHLAYSYEAEIEVYKQKHAEVLEEVHTLRRENYEMRTVVSDPRTQHNMAEVACTAQTLLQAPPGVQPDSTSPDTTTVSEEERDFQKMMDEYQNKLKTLEDQHEKNLQDKVCNKSNLLLCIQDLVSSCTNSCQTAITPDLNRF